jgi:hypothetical protein
METLNPRGRVGAAGRPAGSNECPDAASTAPARQKRGALCRLASSVDSTTSLSCKRPETWVGLGR